MTRKNFKKRKYAPREALAARIIMIKINKIVLISVCIGVVSSCTILPRSGPNRLEVTASTRGENPTAHIVSVTPEVVYETKMSTALGFTKSFLQTKPLNAEL
ncbi:MAG: hypothetical protein ACPG5N_01960, partial [Planktomarina sp.]